jgi:hypothetical protein
VKNCEQTRPNRLTRPKIFLLVLFLFAPNLLDERRRNLALAGTISRENSPIKFVFSAFFLGSICGD